MPAPERDATRTAAMFARLQRASDPEADDVAVLASRRLAAALAASSAVRFREASRSRRAASVRGELERALGSGEEGDGPVRCGAALPASPVCAPSAAREEALPEEAAGDRGGRAPAEEEGDMEPDDAWRRMLYLNWGAGRLLLLLLLAMEGEARRPRKDPTKAALRGCRCAAGEPAKPATKEPGDDARREGRSSASMVVSSTTCTSSSWLWPSREGARAGEVGGDKGAAAAAAGAAGAVADGESTAEAGGRLGRAGAGGEARGTGAAARVGLALEDFGPAFCAAEGQGRASAAAGTAGATSASVAEAAWSKAAKACGFVAGSTECDEAASAAGSAETVLAGGVGGLATGAAP